MNLLTRAKGLFATKGASPCADGSTEGGPGGSWTLSSMPTNFWQMGFNLARRDDYESNAAVEACVSAISQTTAMLPCVPKRKMANGGAEIVKTSAAYRVLRRPNAYQSRADFFLNLIRAELLTGNGYALALRNDRQEIDSLHLIPPRNCHPYISPEDPNDIYYNIGNMEMVDIDNLDLGSMVPARDILHIRLHTPRHPLHGATPLTAAMLATNIGNNLQNSQSNFYTNMSRPSGVLQTDHLLKKEQVDELRERWKEQSQGMNTGGVPILTAGLKWQTMSMTAEDAETIGTYKMSIADIARVFRVPLSVIGDMTGATWNNTEALIRNWIATGLGYTLEHIELALHNLFKLQPDVDINFETDYLLRSDFDSRIGGLVKGVQGGLFSPNEARAIEGLPAAEGGDEPRVQMQVVPLNAWQEELQPDAAGQTPASAPEDEEEPSEDEGEEDVGKLLASVSEEHYLRAYQ